ncbi:MAG TPA: hypothetical protein VLA21_01710, partial [Candidatus Limnocylindria bacterium]|nr:hypothetical protein [Candidatus Limnocylindria bacterium]
MRGRIQWKDFPLTLCVGALLAALAVGTALWPRRDFSALENRRLARQPALTLEGIRNGAFFDATERALADQFPARDAWLSLNSAYDMALFKARRNGILMGKGGRLFEPLPDAAERNISDNAAAVTKLAAVSGLPVWMMLVPMAEAVYPDELPWLYEARDQHSLLALASSRAGVPFEDTLPALT